MRVRGFGAARIYDAVGVAPAGLRELRMVIHQLLGGQRPPASRAADAVSPKGADLRPPGGPLIADRS